MKLAEHTKNEFHFLKKPLVETYFTQIDLYMVDTAWNNKIRIRKEACSLYSFSPKNPPCPAELEFILFKKKQQKM